MTPELKSRIKRIQRHLGLRGDGMIGPVTVSRLEIELGLVARPATFTLEVSKPGIDQLVRFEVGSEARYKRELQAPIWPGGRSGVTVGIGYDLGTQSRTQIEKDWSGRISDEHLMQLRTASGVTGTSARRLARNLAGQGIRVSLDSAKDVFLKVSLPRFAKMTRAAYPGVQRLPADAQAMLLSLIYNRGSSLSSADRRREMRAIKPLVARGDLEGIADQLRAMKRLWDRAKLPGLHTRRDREAKLVENADREYDENELVRI